MIEVLERHRIPPDQLTVEEGCWTNFLGIKTRADLYPAAFPHSGKALPGLPIPGDGVFAGAAEYAAVLQAVESAPDHSRLVVVELGAAHGPWITTAGVVGKRLGFGRIELVGVEASARKVELMKEHLARNGVTAKAIYGAAWWRDTVLQFPADVSQDDYGAAVLPEASLHDYRGRAYAMKRVPAYSVSTICADLGVIDYMHWDLQGAEGDVAVHSRDFLNERVRHVFIGTHSRSIEGILAEMFFRMGWELLLEQPCQFRFDPSVPTLEGMVAVDGEQFWRNPGLRA